MTSGPLSAWSWNDARLSVATRLDDPRAPNGIARALSRVWGALSEGQVRRPLALPRGARVIGVGGRRWRIGQDAARDCPCAIACRARRARGSWVTRTAPVPAHRAWSAKKTTFVKRAMMRWLPPVHWPLGISRSSWRRRGRRRSTLPRGEPAFSSSMGCCRRGPLRLPMRCWRSMAMSPGETVA